MMFMFLISQSQLPQRNASYIYERLPQSERITADVQSRALNFALHDSICVCVDRYLKIFDNLYIRIITYKLLLWIIPPSYVYYSIQHFQSFFRKFTHFWISHHIFKFLNFTRNFSVYTTTLYESTLLTKSSYPSSLQLYHVPYPAFNLSSGIFLSTEPVLSYIEKENFTIFIFFMNILIIC